MEIEDTLKLYLKYCYGRIFHYLRIKEVYDIERSILELQKLKSKPRIKLNRNKEGLLHSDAVPAIHISGSVEVSVYLFNGEIRNCLHPYMVVSIKGLVKVEYFSTKLIAHDKPIHISKNWIGFAKPDGSVNVVTTGADYELDYKICGICPGCILCNEYKVMQIADLFTKMRHDMKTAYNLMLQRLNIEGYNFPFLDPGRHYKPIQEAQDDLNKFAKKCVERNDCIINFNADGDLHSPHVGDRYAPAFSFDCPIGTISIYLFNGRMQEDHPYFIIHNSGVVQEVHYTNVRLLRAPGGYKYSSNPCLAYEYKRNGVVKLPSDLDFYLL